jgi:hypothetical protein
LKSVITTSALSSALRRGTPPDDGDTRLTSAALVRRNRELSIVVMCVTSLPSG